MGVEHEARQFWNLRYYRLALFLHHLLEHRHQISNEFTDVSRLKGELQLSEVHLREIENVVDELQ